MDKPRMRVCLYKACEEVVPIARMYCRPCAKKRKMEQITESHKRSQSSAMTDADREMLKQSEGEWTGYHGAKSVFKAMRRIVDLG